MPFDGVPDLLRRMDVMIVPSRDEGFMRETFCQSMVQGMLTGLPVLVNDLPILTEKLDRGGGRIAATAEELAGAMEELAGDAALRARLGAEGRATALERYVWDSDWFVDEMLFPDG